MSDQINEKKYVCIICPLGCPVTVKYDDKGSIVQILGASCKKGEAYVKEESTNPIRMLTSTVAIKGAVFSRLPVRTSGFIPKNRIFDCMKEIEKVKLKAPVKIGDKIIVNILGLGVDVVATRDLLT